MTVLKKGTVVMRKNHSDEAGNPIGSIATVVEDYSHAQWEYDDLVVVRDQHGQYQEWAYDNLTTHRGYDHV